MPPPEFPIIRAIDRAFLRLIQNLSHCEMTGKPCANHECHCLIEQINYITNEYNHAKQGA